MRCHPVKLHINHSLFIGSCIDSRGKFITFVTCKRASHYNRHLRNAAERDDDFFLEEQSLFQGSRDCSYGHLGTRVLLLLLCCRPWHRPQPHGYGALGTRATGGGDKSLGGQSQALRRRRLEGEPMASIRTQRERTWMCGHAQVAGLAAGPSHSLSLQRKGGRSQQSGHSWCHGTQSRLPMSSQTSTSRVQLSAGLGMEFMFLRL